MATAIVGARRPVRVSTSHASRRALARVGKRAATTGDTIHLDRPRPAPEVIAHELTHVAHPSPTPRFFDDDHRGPEERQAEQVAAIMRRSPILPRTTAATDTIRRSPASRDSAATGTISAAALASAITPTQLTDTVQRLRLGGHRGAPGQTQILTPSPTEATVSEPPPTSTVSPRSTGGPTTSESLAQFDRILELLEDRIITELERRGGRYRGGF